MTPEHAVKTEVVNPPIKFTVEEYQHLREGLIENRRRISRTYGFSSNEYNLAVSNEEDLVAEAIAIHGVKNPRHPNCKECLRVSVFGGPEHDPSGGCRSGHRPHCTCNSCF